jgi:hypothetical protein
MTELVAVKNTKLGFDEVHVYDYLANDLYSLLSSDNKCKVYDHKFRRVFSGDDIGLGNPGKLNTFYVAGHQEITVLEVVAVELNK